MKENTVCGESRNCTIAMVSDCGGARYMQITCAPGLVLTV